jgi:predicted regulator of Ras-like GTPase activity (Roadblock/LC7/MglB family)
LIRGRISPSQRPPPARDQRESAFTAILEDLVRRVPGARSVAIVDDNGETVDYAGSGDPFETRIAAAHWQIALEAVRAQPITADVRSLVVRTHRESFIVHALPDGYALVLRLVRGAGFRGWQRAVPACARRIGFEAGWPDAARFAWFDIDVACDESGRPCSVACGALRERVEVIGKLRGDGPHPEQAWRVRLASGAEATLLCESKRFWYVDEAPSTLAGSIPPKNI